MLTPSGQLVVYTRTPEQNRRTIWGRHFPEFATRETRLHEVNDVRAALEATGAFRSVRAQTVAWPVITSLFRLVEQVTHYHYSTFGCIQKMSSARRSTPSASACGRRSAT